MLVLLADENTESAEDALNEGEGNVEESCEIKLGWQAESRADRQGEGGELKRLFLILPAGADDDDEEDDGVVAVAVVVAGAVEMKRPKQMNRQRMKMLAKHCIFE
ncbi:hypothetical protein BGZ76_005509 [Entomortierella beljakovae]|nr:hypothetical protein BGZ76_005509 [Entomortierella beljakovae]